MKLLETYSNNSSVDIKHKPSLVEKFFPLGGIDKYITLQTKTGMPAKDYDYFQEVVNLLFPILEKEGIKILHLGQDSPPIANVINLNNQTSISQAAYILKRSLLHLGADSWMAHFCGAEDVPLVSLYGNTTVANHSPYFYNENKTIFLESHRNGNKASFAREENPKTVDFICPITVASSVCKLLNLEFNYPFKTLFIGQNYQIRIVESLPNQVVALQNLGINQLIVRMDYHFDEANLWKQISVGKVLIVTDRPINPEILNAGRPNISEIIYVLKQNLAPNAGFCKSLNQLKIPYKLMSWEKPEVINNWRLNFMDYGIIFPQSSEAPKEIDINKIKEGKLYYKSSKTLLASTTMFQSLADFKNNRPIDKFEPTLQQVSEENLEDLWKDNSYLYFLEKII